MLTTRRVSRVRTAVRVVGSCAATQAPSFTRRGGRGAEPGSRARRVGAFRRLGRQFDLWIGGALRAGLGDLSGPRLPAEPFPSHR